MRSWIKAGGAAGHAQGQRAVVAVDVLVRVPVPPGEAVVVAAPDLHEPDAPLEQAAGGQALAAEVLGLLERVDLLVERRLAVIEAVEPEHFRGLAGEVQRLGRGELHPGGQLVALDPAVEPVVAGARGGVLAVQAVQQSDPRGVARAGGERDALVGEEVGDGRLGAGVDDGPLVLRGKERRVPVLGAVGGEAAMVGQHDERGQVVGQAAQPVADPRAHRGEAGPVEAGRLEQRPLAVHAGLADDVVDEGDVVDDGPQRRDDVAEHLAARAVGLERRRPA